jgi:hypothetical protein
MPRVGSSNRKICVSVASQRPMIAFCWLPPEKLPMGRVTSKGRRRTSCIKVSARAFKKALRMMPNREKRRMAGRPMLLVTGR